LESNTSSTQCAVENNREFRYS